MFTTDQERLDVYRKKLIQIKRAKSVLREKLESGDSVSLSDRAAQCLAIVHFSTELFTMQEVLGLTMEEITAFDSE